MKRQIRCLATTVLLGIAPVLWAASHAESLFQDAMVKETGERDPEAAVALYRQVIEEGGSNHRLVAKARLHMGNCLERMGKPKEAEEVYLQIVQDSAAALTEAAQAAQANLQKLEAQDKKVREEAERAAQMKPKPMVLVKEFQASRFTGLVGVSALKSGSASGFAGEAALRYRLSPILRPLSLSAEVGGFIPFGNVKADDATVNYQMHVAFVADLPHGMQRKWVPEIGAGAALTASEAAEAQHTWSPYFLAGVHLFPERRLSGLINACYTANPYSASMSPALNVPTSLWTVMAQLQIKIGWTKTVLRVKE